MRDNKVLLLQRTNLVGICKSRLAEAILTNKNNICFSVFLNPWAKHRRLKFGLLQFLNKNFRQPF